MDPIAQARIEAIAALRKAAGLERLLGRLRSPSDEPNAPVAIPTPRPQGMADEAQDRTTTAA
jgi:hypothetical protein